MSEDLLRLRASPMGDNTKIEWARHPVTGKGASWNPLLARTHFSGKVGYHCEHVSPGCKFCYAETFNQRPLPSRGTGLAFKPGHRDLVDIFLDEDQLLAPLRWKAPRGIFVCSMTDLFGEFVSDEQIDRVFAVMAMCPQHVFFVLTKRPERMREYFEARRTGDPWADAADYVADVLGQAEHPFVLEPRHIPLPNVWLGTSAEDQDWFRKRWPILRATPAAVRFLSLEPLLGRIDVCEELGIWWNQTTGEWVRTPGVVLPHWVIAGGESGTGARPMHPDWARSLRDQCAGGDVPFFFKQWGAWVTAPEGMSFDEAMRWARTKRYSLSAPTQGWGGGGGLPSRYHVFPDGRVAFHTGKKDAGRNLDGAEHNAMPRVS